MFSGLLIEEFHVSIVEANWSGCLAHDDYISRHVCASPRLLVNRPFKKKKEKLKLPIILTLKIFKFIDPIIQHTSIQQTLACLLWSGVFLSVRDTVGNIKLPFVKFTFWWGEQTTNEIYNINKM